MPRRLLTTLCALSVLASACTARAPARLTLRKGELLPADKRRAAGNVAGHTMNGGAITLAQFRGHAVLLNFWASWCGPCTTEAPQLDAVYRRMKAAGVEFVGVNVKDDPGRAADFVREQRISYPMIVDEPARSAMKLGNVPLSGLPVTVLIDKIGRVAAVYQVVVAPADIVPPLTALARE